MKLYLKCILIVLLLTFTACHHRTPSNRARFLYPEAITKFPKPNGYVNDFENLLTAEQQADLNTTIHTYRGKTTNEIAIVTIDSIMPYTTLRDFTTDLGNYWGVGQDDKDNGLLIVVSKKLRNVWIGTGYGTEKVLTDPILTKIIDTAMTPHFKKGEFYEGIKAGTLQCIAHWK